MEISSTQDVRELYESAADSYAEMMNSEIELPLYTEILSRLAERITDIPGAVVDTSCGPGHWLQKYHESCDSERPLIGIDLSPRMVELAESRLGAAATIFLGDMRDMRRIESDSAAAVLSFFAIHHLSSDDAVAALAEWNRILRPGGLLMVGIWEGTGRIDYGKESDIVAHRYSEQEITEWVRQTGFRINRCVVEPVDDFPMHAVYLDASAISASPA